MPKWKDTQVSVYKLVIFKRRFESRKQGWSSQGGKKSRRDLMLTPDRWAEAVKMLDAQCRLVLGHSRQNGASVGSSLAQL